MDEIQMHVMVATDGSLDAAASAKMAARLAGSTGRVTVFTAVEVPRQILTEMRDAVSQGGAEPGSVVEFRRTQADDAPVGSWIGDDAFVANYVKRLVATRTGDLVTALEATGVSVEVVGVESESPARSVLDAVKGQAPDIVCIGTHGMGRFEGLLGSLSTKIARLAPCPVLLIR